MFLSALCLAANVYFESRGEPIDGQILVAEVTMNRVHDKAYPKNVCSVVYQDRQFSWTSEPHEVDDLEAFITAYRVATEVLDNGCVLCTDATHYHTIDSSPYWSDDLQVIGEYGNHIFYKE